MTSWPGRELFGACCQFVHEIGGICAATGAELFNQDCEPLGTIGLQAGHALGSFRVLLDAFTPQSRLASAADYVPVRVDYGACEAIAARVATNPESAVIAAQQIEKELGAIPTEWEVRGQLEKVIHVASSNSINGIKFDLRTTLGCELDHLLVHALHHLCLIGAIARNHAATGKVVGQQLLTTKFPSILHHRFYGRN